MKFKNRGKVYFFDPHGIAVRTGEKVVVETSRGLELAECVQGNHAVPDETVVQPLRSLARIATKDDLRIEEINRRREKEAFQICKQKIAEHGLDMKLVDVECSFEGNKTMFFFTSDGRVTSASWSRISPPCSATASSCGRSACATRRRCSAASASAAGFLLLAVFGRLRPRFDQDGQDAESEPEPDEDLRHVRQAHVLPQIRAERLRGRGAPLPEAGFVCRNARRPWQRELGRHSARAGARASRRQNESPKRYRTCEIHVLRNGKGSRDASSSPRRSPSAIRSRRRMSRS